MELFLYFLLHLYAFMTYTWTTSWITLFVRVDRAIVLSVALRDKLKSVDIDCYRFFTVQSRDIAKCPDTVPLYSAFPQTLNVLT
jgi:hypothetical protein